MAQAAQAAPVGQIPKKRGFFHMLGRIWDTVTVVIDSAHDLAETVNLHTENIKLSTQVELNADLQNLRNRLNVQ
jgi:hypothetical protein